MKLLLLFMMLIMTTSCTAVNYQAIALSKDGSFNVSGSETGLFSMSKAIVLECEKESKTDYVCAKRYPGEAVALYGDLTMKR